MRLLICAGGTGGGIYPALSVLQSMPAESQELMEASDTMRSDQRTLWIGGAGDMDFDLVNRAGVPFESIPAAGVHGVGIRALPGNLWQLGRGLLAARRVLRRFRPEVMFFTGGYVGVPVAIAGRLPGRNTPRPAMLLYVPDIEPGLALKVLSHFADNIAVTVGDAITFLPRRVSRRVPITVTGYPVRPGLSRVDRESALQSFDLSSASPTLLIMGGSTGARSINRAVCAVLPELLAEFQVIHISGKLDWQEIQSTRAKLPDDLSNRYRVYPYLHEEMGLALAAADLAVTRAGASTLGELPFFGLPAILVPYPYAWRYQKVNADYLAQRGAAVVVADEDLQSRLWPEIRRLVLDRTRLEAMRKAMASLAQPDAASLIGSLLRQLAGKQRKRRI